MFKKKTRRDLIISWILLIRLGNFRLIESDVDRGVQGLMVQLINWRWQTVLESTLGFLYSFQTTLSLIKSQIYSVNIRKFYDSSKLQRATSQTFLMSGESLCNSFLN